MKSSNRNSRISRLERVATTEGARRKARQTSFDLARLTEDERAELEAIRLKFGLDDPENLKRMSLGELREYRDLLLKAEGITRV